MLRDSIYVIFLFDVVVRVWQWVLMGAGSLLALFQATPCATFPHPEQCEEGVTSDRPQSMNTQCIGTSDQT